MPSGTGAGTLRTACAPVLAYGGAMSLLARRPRRATDLVIADPEHHTVIADSGAVRSIQVALITLPRPALEQMWSPLYLERLARTYWDYLSRATLGLIRITYEPDSRRVVLLARPLTLLRFDAPEYVLSADRGIVRWRIRGGLLVDGGRHTDDGYLEIDVSRQPGPRPGLARVRVEVEVANFYPAIASWFTRGLYSATQSRIHVLVTHGYLRSLSRLELKRSPVGRFDAPGPAALADQLTVGHTPWGVLGGLLLLAVALSRRRRQP